MDADQEDRISHLFIVRLWLDREKVGEAHNGHGMVQNVITGKAMGFDSLPLLSDLLLEMTKPKDARDERSSIIREQSDERGR